MHGPVSSMAHTAWKVIKKSSFELVLPNCTIKNETSNSRILWLNAILWWWSQLCDCNIFVVEFITFSLFKLDHDKVYIFPHAWPLIVGTNLFSIKKFSVLRTSQELWFCPGLSIWKQNL